MILPLSQLALHQKGKIAYIDASDVEFFKKMLSLGIISGREIILLQKFPSFRIGLGNAQFALDSEAAAKIMVEVDM